MKFDYSYSAKKSRCKNLINQKSPKELRTTTLHHQHLKMDRYFKKETALLGIQ